jgi:hypothetical protein
MATATMQKLTWDEWCTALVAIVGDAYGPNGAIKECGEGAWRGYFVDGYSPEDAAVEDRTYWD